MFKVGGKVICIKKGLWKQEFMNPKSVTYPRNGDKLTIRTFESDKKGSYIRFEEIVNPIFKYTNGFKEIQFKVTRFTLLISDLTKELTQDALNDNPEIVEKKILTEKQINYG